ncbi:uncharacterized protein LOC107767391 isoform X1 [Nicotiana tabacum]|uniref:Uncharacterized protein LOC107767391 isoform X1 n=2 Tax=Nicotiana tabacum TaxID=4097 RepID=A0AC58UEH9_TOBAC|nr:uncharacterized protein LOC104113071 isoform X1 [Nicotiana tomentosiformis]XP_016441873.1 PREDICTED: uncharacterized protein LOC107767391 isoform X1 [Nicotiana tabacum]
MAGREVREYTNLTDPKDRKFGKGKDKIDDEEIAFHRMVSKMQDVAGERGGYLHGRGALDSDDLLYLKEQMEAEEDAERLLRRTEKRAFQAFKKAVTDSSPVLLPLALRVEPKPKSGIRQQDLLKRVVEVKSKKPKVSNPSNGNDFPVLPSTQAAPSGKCDADHEKQIETLPARPSDAGDRGEIENPVKSLLAVYESSDDDD